MKPSSIFFQFGKSDKFFHKIYIRFLNFCAKLRFPKQQPLAREVECVCLQGDVCKWVVYLFCKCLVCCFSCSSHIGVVALFMSIGVVVFLHGATILFMLVLSILRGVISFLVLVLLFFLHQCYYSFCVGAQVPCLAFCCYFVLFWCYCSFYIGVFFSPNVNLVLLGPSCPMQVGAWNIRLFNSRLH